MRKKPAIPIMITATPIIAKIAVQLSLLPRSKDINPPKTASIATSGIIELMPSAAPRFVSSVTSVSQALKQASFAEEPKNVITQSIIITSVTQTAETEAAAGKIAPITSSRIRQNERMDMPQSIYPPHMNAFLLPSLSESAPIRSVVSVAATALAATIAEISAADAPNIL